MDRDDVINKIHEALTEFDSQKTAAKKWHLSPSYLTDVLRGRRKPGQKILRVVGLQRIEAYEPR